MCENEQVKVLPSRVCPGKTTWRSVAWSCTLHRTWRSSGKCPLTSWRMTARTSWSLRKTRRSTSGEKGCFISDSSSEKIKTMKVNLSPPPQPADRLEVHSRGGGADQSLPRWFQRGSSPGVAPLLWREGAGGERDERVGWVDVGPEAWVHWIWTVSKNCRKSEIIYMIRSFKTDIPLLHPFKYARYHF